MLHILRQLESALEEIGSGLSAVDKIGDWSYYQAAQKKADNLLGELPSDIRAMLPKQNPSMTNWHSFLGEVRALRKKYSQ